MQVATPANWARASIDKRKHKENDPAAYHRFVDEFWPSRVLMSIPVYGHKVECSCLLMYLCVGKCYSIDIYQDITGNI